MTDWYKIYDFRLDGSEPQKVYTVRTIEVNDTLVCLGRLPDGYFAVADKCPHAGGRLGMGQCTEEGKVVCPHHRFKYNLKTGRGDEGDYVRHYQTETRADGVYIGFETGKKWWQLWK